MRPLDGCYPIVFFDALRVKIRDEGLVKNKAVYVALALDGDGHKHVLGLWIEQTEGAKFWLKVMNDLKTRGVSDILIAVVDGLKGFPGRSARSSRGSRPDLHCPLDPQLAGLRVVEGPQNHYARSEGDLPGSRRRGGPGPARRVRGDMGRPVSGDRPDLAAGVAYVTPFFAFPPDIRKMIYTTNAVESLNRSLRKIIKTRGSFPNDEAAIKLLYLAIQNAIHWRRPVPGPPPWVSLPSCSAIDFLLSAS